jgi:hypothetical protein
MYLLYSNIELKIKGETGHGKTSCRCKKALANQQAASLVTADKNGFLNLYLMGFVKVRDREILIMANVF